MVGREVAHQADASCVGGCGESRHGLIATEQRIDLAKGRGVIAVVRFGREKRRQIDRPNPERRDMIQMRRDAIEISAEVLTQRVRSLTDHRVVPIGGLCPAGGRTVDRLREPVRKDLVHRARRPLRRRVVRAEPEVGSISDVVAV